MRTRRFHDFFVILRGEKNWERRGVGDVVVNVDVLDFQLRGAGSFVLNDFKFDLFEQQKTYFNTLILAFLTDNGDSEVFDVYN